MANEKKLIKLEQLDHYNDKIFDEISKVAIQVSTMPTPSASLVGKIYQYTGQSTATLPLYIHGWFYECKGVPTINPQSYEWQAIEIMDISGKQNTTLMTPLTIGGTTQTTVEGALGGLNTVKSDKAKIVDTFTLTTSGWDSTTHIQELTIYPTYTIDEDHTRNVIDINPSNLQTWSDNGVRLYDYIIVSETTGHYIQKLQFKCTTIPSANLTFRIISMEVTS